MSVEQGPLQNTAQIRHLPNTIKQKLWAPNYDVIVAMGRAAMHFLRLRLIVQVGTALGWGSILKKTKKWSSIMISWIRRVLSKFIY